MKRLDAFTLSSVDEFGPTTTSRADLYTILPSSCSSYSQPMSYEPYIQTTSVISAPSQINGLTTSYKEETDGQKIFGLVSVYLFTCLCAASLLSHLFFVLFNHF